MLSGVWDECHDIVVILLSLLNQALNISITYLLWLQGWNSYYIASLVFVILCIVSQSTVFTVRFVPCYSVRKKCTDLIKPICHIAIYFIIGIIIAPLTSLIIYITERCLNQRQMHWRDRDSANSNNKNKCIRVYGCVYIQPHESILNQWMHLKFAKYVGFLVEMIVNTLPHLFTQILFLLNKASKSKLNDVNNDGLLMILQLSIVVAILNIMIKTFIFGYGFDNKIYIFSWLCYMTDFLHILFLILFIFYAQDPVCITYLGINTANTSIAHIFMFIVSYSIIPLTVAVSFSVGAYISGDIVEDFWWEWYWYLCCCPCVLIAWLCLSSFICIAVAIGLIFLNMSIFARWTYDKQRRFQYIAQIEVTEIINYIIEFINKKSSVDEQKLYSYPDNDKVIRILSINSAYHKIRFENTSGNDKIVKFIRETAANHTWGNITEKHIVDLDYKQKVLVSVFKYKALNEYVQFVVESYKSVMTRWNNMRTVDSCNILQIFFCGLPFLIVFIVVSAFHLVLFMYLCSRILIVFYPIIVLIDAFGDNEYLALHWVVLMLFIGCYIWIFVLGFNHIIPVFDTLQMIRPGDTNVSLTFKSNTKESFIRNVNSCYGVVQLSKYIEQMLITKFGDDVAAIIVEYAFEHWMITK